MAFYSIQQTGQAGAKNWKLSDEHIREVFKDIWGQDSGPDLETLYKRVGYLWQCVNLRAMALAFMPWQITDQAGRVVYEPDSDLDQKKINLASLQKYPWLAQVRRRLYLVEASLCLVHRAFILKERDQGKLVNLYWLNPETIRPEMRDGIQYFVRRVNGQEQRFMADDMLAISMMDPFSEGWAGLGRLGSGLAAMDSAKVLYSLDQFLAKYTGSGLIKATLLTVETPDGKRLPDPQKQALESWWRRWFRGRMNPENQEIISASVKPVTVGEGVKDLNSPELSQSQREAIATAVGVPHHMVMSNSANYATADLDERGFLTRHMIPRSVLVADAMNEQLFQEFNLEIQFMPERLEVMQQFELKKAQQIQQLVGRPVLTVNEGRDMLGKDELSDDEISRLPGAPILSWSSPRSSVGWHESDLDGNQVNELKQWAKVVARKGNSAEFVCHYLPGEIQSIISERLKAGLPRPFSSPFVSF